MFKFFILVFTLASLTQAFASENKPALTVYTYDSFLSSWGPGPTIKHDFESSCACQLKWVAAADGAALLARLKLEGEKTKADVVVGIDDTSTAAAERLGLFAEPGLKLPPMEFGITFPTSAMFIPYDYGFYAFMFDTQARQKNGQPFPKPRSLRELLTSKSFERKVMIQDPRSSAAGLGLLLWLKSVYDQRFEDALNQLRSQTLTVSRGWSESYNLFTKGEAPLVLSYTTSEAYHREIEKQDRFQALLFPEGHYVTIETAGMLKTSKNPKLAKLFLEHLIKETSQKTIAQFNWMYPAVRIKAGLPASILALRRPEKVLRINPQTIVSDRLSWINQWEKIFSR